MDGMGLGRQQTRETWPDYFDIDTAGMQVGADQAPAVERCSVIEQFNATRVSFPERKLIQEIFESQVARTPSAVAVSYGERLLTYEELNCRANRLARCLRERGAGPDRLVGICIDRGPELVVALLAALKAGAAYLPLDPTYPTRRLAHMIEDAEPTLLVTHGPARAVLPQATAQIIAIDADRSEIERHSSQNLPATAIGLNSAHLAYVIYTSGSTGRPKGVMIEHRNVLSLWQGLEPIYREHGPCLRVGVNASYSFDASVKQFVQLLSGRTLVPIPQAVRSDASAFVRFVREHQLDAVDCTPSQLRAWLEAGLLNGPGHSPRLILIGGEPIDAGLWEHLARCSTTAFYNVYGPTEITVDATFACINGDSTPPHIGRPLQNRRVYILDASARPVSIGSTGELYIGGAGVARGYLKRPLLTAERFLMDPFDTVDFARMYKSGDLARWRQDGTIEYLGRNDHQIKIRGFRVELGEIEAQLSRMDQIGQAVVVAREDVPHQKRLVAYVVPKHAAMVPSVEALRTHLETALPPYMVPNAFVTMADLPLTANGKIDRNALPVPQAGAYRTRDFEAPSGEFEQTIAAIWQELLGVERPGRHDHFFELGGDSLTATQVGTRIQALLSIDIAVSTVFDFPILSELAEKVAEMRHARWQEAIAAAGDDMEELLNSVAALPDIEVRRLLDEMTAEAR